MKLGEVGDGQVIIAGQTQTIFERGTLANPLLRPERTREAEYGADATFLSGAITTQLTWYRRRTDDLLQIRSHPQGLPDEWGNVGDVSAHGFEATVGTRLIENKFVRAGFNFTYGVNTDKLLSLGDEAANPFNAYDVYRVGYPLGAIFIRPILEVADTVGGGPDGIVFPQEVIHDSVSRFIGVTISPKTFSLTPTISLFGDRLRFSTEFDRQIGFVIQNYANVNGFGLATLVKTTPLLEQAKYMESSNLYERGDFTRWRELSLSTDLPQRLLRAVFLSRGAVNFQVRNLAMWTRYSGSDPESTPGGGLVGSHGIVRGTTGIPLARAWNISFDVTP